jgi:hypothetical protein
MGQTFVQPKPIRRPLFITLILFAILWTVTITTWLYDEAGYTIGMPMPIFFVSLAAPLVAGLVIGWPKRTLGSGVKAGALAGALFGAANIVAEVVWGGVLYLMGRMPPDQPFTFIESVFEALEFLILFMVVGLVLGAIGGLIGAAIGGARTPKQSS